MVRRYTLILNLFLIVVSFFLVERVYQIWKSDGYQDIDTAAVSETDTLGDTPPRSSMQTRRAPRKEYDVVVEKDLFRPQRTEWAASQQEIQTNTAGTPAKQMRVYGIVIADELRQAWVQEEGKREKLQKVSEGDTLDGWKVSKIDFDAVSFSRGDETVTYQLIEPGKPKQRAVPQALVRQAPKPQRVQAPPPRPRPPRKPPVARRTPIRPHSR